MSAPWSMSSAGCRISWSASITRTPNAPGATGGTAWDNLLPSDCFHRSVFLSFQEDQLGLRDRTLIGVDNLMWGQITRTRKPRSALTADPGEDFSGGARGGTGKDHLHQRGTPTLMASSCTLAYPCSAGMAMLWLTQPCHRCLRGRSPPATLVQKALPILACVGVYTRQSQY